MLKKNFDSMILHVYILIYGVIGIFTLTRFPLIHSDEAWLAGLSLNYLKEKSVFVTEPFFNLMPRQPHLIKSLFHLLQGLFIKAFGYNIFSVRLISLVASVIILQLTTIYLRKKSYPLPLTIMALMVFSLNIQFVYAGHFARQEMPMMLSLVLCFLLFDTASKESTQKFLIPTLLGLSIGLHPNAFIISAMIGVLYLKDTLTGAMKVKTMVWFTSILFVFASLFALMSFAGNPGFFTDYWAYGSTLSVDALPLSRLQNFFDFYTKLYFNISGSYYLPPMKCFFILTLLVSLISTVVVVAKKGGSDIQRQLSNGLLMLLGFNVALYIIGRYNPTSIAFMLIPSYLMGFNCLRLLLSDTKNFTKKLKLKTISVLSLLFIMIIYSAGLLYHQYSFSNKGNYEAYTQEIASHLPDNPVVLGNLSSGFIFQDIPFYDFRNLAFLNGVSLADYIRENHINTVIYYEEYDYIHRNNQWDILYGEDTYYDALTEFLDSQGELVYTFEAPYYGTRIIRYMGDYPWSVKIYSIASE